MTAHLDTKPAQQTGEVVFGPRVPKPAGPPPHCEPPPISYWDKEHYWGTVWRCDCGQYWRYAYSALSERTWYRIGRLRGRIATMRGHRREIEEITAHYRPFDSSTEDLLPQIRFGDQAPNANTLGRPGHVYGCPSGVFVCLAPGVWTAMYECEPASH